VVQGEETLQNVPWGGNSGDIAAQADGSPPTAPLTQATASASNGEQPW
jgi:hypothetical protein